MFEKNYYLVDDCTSTRGAIWNTKMIATNSMDAVKEMWREWGALTKHDQKDRDEFFCISGDEQELYAIKMRHLHNCIVERPEEVI